MLNILNACSDSFVSENLLDLEGKPSKENGFNM